ncbi:hypothetical protein BC827DRAFT_1242112 [Russula dissimulans]|nr:hypothetical protein BC827DRAFT_1242112 [Russula dissimulans]
MSLFLVLSSFLTWRRGLSLPSGRFLEILMVKPVATCWTVHIDISHFHFGRILLSHSAIHSMTYPSLSNTPHPDASPLPVSLRSRSLSRELVLNCALPPALRDGGLRACQCPVVILRFSICLRSFAYVVPASLFVAAPSRKREEASCRTEAPRIWHEQMGYCYKEDTRQLRARIVA